MPALIFQGAILSLRAADLSHGASGDKTGVGCPCLGTLLVQPRVEVAGEGTLSGSSGPGQGGGLALRKV